MVEGPTTSNVKNSGIVDNYHNSVLTDSPAFAYPSSYTVYPEGQVSLDYLDVQLRQYSGGPVSTIAVAGHPPGYNTFLDTELSHPALYSLP